MPYERSRRTRPPPHEALMKSALHGMPLMGGVAMPEPFPREAKIRFYQFEKASPAEIREAFFSERIPG